MTSATQAPIAFAPVQIPGSCGMSTRAGDEAVASVLRAVQHKLAPDSDGRVASKASVWAFVDKRIGAIAENHPEIRDCEPEILSVACDLLEAAGFRARY